MAAKRFNLLERFNELNRPLILDGAMGSLLQQKGIEGDPVLWYSKINFDNPKLVKTIHEEYINAGADIITTNTFRTNPAAIKLSGHKIDETDFVKKSVRIAVDARNDKKIIIAGSNAPAEDCYQKERTISKFNLEYNHKKHIELLWESGADIIWNETHSHWDEIEIICKFCSTNSLPFAVNLYFEESLTLLSGEPLFEVVDFINEFKPEAIGFNCIKPEIFTKYFQNNYINGNWGFYFNCGAGNINDEHILCGINPQEYLNEIKNILPGRPAFIGSCCGSSPLHTKAIKDYLNEVYRN